MVNDSSADTSSPNLTGAVTVIIVSSYSPFHPNTYLIDSVCKSLRHISGLQDCHKIIVLDGYETVSSTEKAEIKKGKLKQHMVDAYELYCKRLQYQYANSNCTVIRNSAHQGFAYSVKIGLQATQTTYAMILQQDRIFCTSLPATVLPQCIDIMNSSKHGTHIRYIGFPTTSSRTHIAQIECRYQGIGCLNEWKHRILLKDSNSSSNSSSSNISEDHEHDSFYGVDDETDVDLSHAVDRDNVTDSQDSVGKNSNNSNKDTVTSNIISPSVATVDNNYYGLFLQPCIFWFDSNHFCHVERYLKMYTPYLTIPTELKQILGLSRVRELLLRRGDFIEDRWGQMQRKLLTQIIPQEVLNKKISNKTTRADLGATRVSEEVILTQDGTAVTENQHVIGNCDGRSKLAAFDVNDITNVNKNDNNGNDDDKNNNNDDDVSDLLVSSFRWFGSYLLWQTDKQFIGYNSTNNDIDNSDDDYDDDDVNNNNNYNTTSISTTASTTGSSWARFPPLAGATATAAGELAHSCNISRVFVRHLNGRRKIFAPIATTITTPITTTSMGTIIDLSEDSSSSNDNGQTVAKEVEKIDDDDDKNIKNIDKDMNDENKNDDAKDLSLILKLKYQHNKNRHHKNTIHASNRHRYKSKGDKDEKMINDDTISNHNNNNNNNDDDDDDGCTCVMTNSLEDSTLDILFSSSSSS